MLNRIVLWSPVVLLFLAAASQAAPKPNVLLIMADDLGFSDLGCYGSEIQTPNLDRLAANGLRFTQFYNTARCWPTRAALLTGYYAQQVRRDRVPGVRSGGRGVRQPWARLLPVYLKPLGYRSYHSGKWHLDGMPLANGFDRSYYLRDQNRFFDPNGHFEDDRPLPAVEKDSGYYATTAIGDHAIKCLKEHAKNYPGKPFFHYIAFTAPHFPLQALPEDIAKYEKVYQQGWAEVRRKRWAKMQASGLLAGRLSAVEREVGPPYDLPEHVKQLGDGEVNRPVPWESLTPRQQRMQASKMAIHAAMIDRMDAVIGRVLEQVGSMGQMDNTVVFFLSDNGASAEIMVRGDGHDPNAAPGSARTYLCLGPGWSTTSNTPFRRHKTWTHEGGISTPLIVSWPKGISARGEFRRTPGHVIDIVPTILELTGGQVPTQHHGKPVPDPPGRSLVSAFHEDVTIERDYLWWFHDGHKAVRIGDWKAVALNNGAWEFYNLADDRAEFNDLARSEPGKSKELVAMWDRRMAEFTQLALQDLPKPSANPKPRAQAARQESSPGRAGPGKR